MCFWPELVTPLSKSAQIALVWDTWFPTSLCRRVEEGLAPEVCPNLPFIGICPKSSDSVAVLQTSEDMNICLYPSCLLKNHGWMAECCLSYISGKTCSASSAVILCHRLCHLHTDCLLAME